MQEYNTESKSTEDLYVKKKTKPYINNKRKLSGFLYNFGVGKDFLS